MNIKCCCSNPQCTNQIHFRLGGITVEDANGKEIIEVYLDPAGWIKLAQYARHILLELTEKEIE
jgi:hypothetical protein